MRFRLWIALHLVLVLLPGAAMITRAPDVPLYGVEAASAAPEWSVRAWLSERFQPALQAAFESRIGLRGVMVRSDNSAHVALLRAEKPSSSIVLGEDGTLLFKDDVAHFSRRASDVPAVIARIEALAARLGSAHRKLARAGKKLVVMIAPSKASVYPEEVPARSRRGDERPDRILHDVLRSSLEREGIACGDGYALMAGKTGEQRELLFPRTGRHWSVLGACLVFREALRDGPVTPSCDYDMLPTNREHGGEYDLHRLQNLWRFESSAPVVPIVKPQREAPMKPRAFFAGTSFTWIFVDFMAPLVDERPLAVQYNAMFEEVGKNRVLLGVARPDSPQWSERVLGRDLYVVELFESLIDHDYNLGFAEALDARLE